MFNQRTNEITKNTVIQIYNTNLKSVKTLFFVYMHFA